MNESKFTVRDLINAGLFSVLTLVFYWVAGMIGYFPVLMPIVPFTCALLSGVVFMLYSTRIKKFGMILIMGIIFGLVFAMSGHGLHVALAIPVLSLLSEYIMRKGDYKSINHARWAYTVFGLVGGINMLPLYLSREAAYNKLIQTDYGAEYADQLFSILPPWSLVPIALLGMVGAYIGCTIGIRLLKKHFERAGMA